MPEYANTSRCQGKVRVLLPVFIGFLCLVVSITAAQQEEQNHSDSSGQPEDHITLNVEKADIADVLKVLSRQRRVNIVAGKDVTGAVSINLYDVPFEMALRAILRVNGFTYYNQDNVIFVTKTTKQSADDLRPSRAVMQTFRLNYANIAEASDMVGNVLSPDGKMVVGKQSKTLLVQDTPEALEQITALLQTLDTRPRQVLIEAKILEVALDSDTTLGIDWSVLFGQSSLGGRLGTALTQGFATNPLSGAAGLFFSVVDENADVLVSALQERTNLNTLASPKILAVDGQEAQILIGQKLGFRITTTTQTSTLESVEFLDVGTQLLIRPLISDDGYILMDVHPKVSDGKVELGLPNETTTEATTSVLVKDGTTIVIGGLIRERDEESRAQIPGLGDVPLLGALFRRREARKRKTEIAVLITPYIVREISQEASIPETPAVPQQVGKIWDADFVMALSNSL